MSYFLLGKQRADGINIANSFCTKNSGRRFEYSLRPFASYIRITSSFISLKSKITRLVHFCIREIHFGVTGHELKISKSASLLQEIHKRAQYEPSSTYPASLLNVGIHLQIQINKRINYAVIYYLPLLFSQVWEALTNSGTALS